MAYNGGAGGRPSSYKDIYPSLLIEEMGRKGLSVVRFCALPELEVCKDTFYEWLKVHKEFSDAFRVAKNMCEAFWETRVLELWQGEKVNSPLVKLYMANRFDWHDKRDTVVNATIKHEDSLKDLE